jgi:translocation and assembly module TamA
MLPIASRRVLTLLLLVAGLAAPGLARRAMADDADAPLADRPIIDEAAVPYTVRIEGVRDPDLLRLLQRSSQLVTLAERPPVSQAALMQRIERDRERFQAVLRSEGYYAGWVDAELTETAAPPLVVMRVDPGPAFTIRSYAVVVTADTAAAPAPPSLADIGITIGERARGAIVLAGERRALEALAERAHPLAGVRDREIIVDFADNSMHVRLDVDPSPLLGFGPVTITGLTSVEEAYVRRLIPWAEGDPYDRREVERFRRKLVRTGLFSTVVITPAQVADSDARLPLTVELVEAKSRSFGGGLKYYTSEGPAGEVFWEHRNLLGYDEDLRFTAEIGTIAQKVEVDVLFPNYRRVDQDLVGQSVLMRETTDAYDKTGIETVGRIRRVLNEVWAASLGTSVETAWLKERDRTENSTLFGLPAFAYRDTTNSQLNPSEGSRLRLAPTPYVGWYTDSLQFLSNELTGSAYLSLDSAERYVLAGRAKVGALFGPSRADIPPDKRFYAGGGSSVRGYPFQKVGPLDDDDDPLGGRSLFEMSAELRTRVWGNFGIVPFIDGGSVYQSMLPDFSETMRWGAGIGLRYHTAIGPVRADVAFPINPRQDIDDPVQFYINIGQAF